MDPQTSSSGYRDRNSTADRALTILDMFTETKLSVSALEVATALSVARSTAYRYLESLVSRGFIEESPTGGFRLGLRILELAHLARQGFGLSDIALPIMRQLCDQVGQTVLLTRRAGTAAVCLEREVPLGQLLRISYERGSQLPLTAGASALVLLAWLDDAEARALFESIQRPRFTDKTLTTTDELIERLHQIREVGYCMTHAEVDTDALGMAAPIFDGEGRVTAGLSIVALGSRVNQIERLKIIRALRMSAEKISSKLQIAAG
ncbi:MULTISPECIES: IclR family transcriptional regulator [unclassified Glutamicibacter]|uniref:IclR family transcriptional regulator n=1 Tax=unclassified Glutamicibacter TaxID=2627139 RepID=UPI00382C79C5